MTGKHDDNGPWAKSALRIESAVLSVEEIGRRMGQASTDAKAPNCWIVDLEPDDSLPLNDQLPAVERFIAAKIDVLEELAPACEIDLFLGWHPEAGQDGIVFQPSLIKLLGRIGAVVTLDTYTRSEDDDPPND
ncbi:MAG: hypothetical protein GEV03_10140 [Streptosporangiales bacterium]|nr:hypothetical protein [Streptosporangiales bacterium]